MGFARVRHTDGLQRFRAGEIGLILENDFTTHYDYKLDLGTAWAEPLGGGEPRLIQRIFYFTIEDF
jgi:hypothetical protein